MNLENNDGNVRSTNSKCGALTVLIVTIAGLMLVLTSCGKKEEPPAKEVIRPVKVITIGSLGDEFRQSYPGKVRASQRVDLAFKVAGPLVKLPVEEGQNVKKGQLIARVMPRDFETSVKKAKAQALEAEQQFRRYKELFIRKQVSKADFDRYKSARDVAKAQQKRAEDTLTDTYLRAPFSGVIAKRFVENFEEVQAKQPIVSLQDVSWVEILVDVPEVIIAKVRNRDKMKVFAEFAFAPGQQYPLILKEYATEADPQTQTYQIVLTMKQPKGVNVLPGMTASVVGKTERDTQTDKKIVVPAIAVLGDTGDKAYVWVLDSKEMKVHKKTVSVGPMTGSENINIPEGLAAGDKIVVTGMAKLQEGMKVTIWKP